MTDTDKIMNPRLFGSDLADIRIRKSGFESRVSFSLEISALAEFALSLSTSGLVLKRFIHLVQSIT